MFSFVFLRRVSEIVFSCDRACCHSLIVYLLSAFVDVVWPWMSTSRCELGVSSFVWQWHAVLWHHGFRSSCTVWNPGWVGTKNYLVPGTNGNGSKLCWVEVHSVGTSSIWGVCLTPRFETCFTLNRWLLSLPSDWISWIWQAEPSFYPCLCFHFVHIFISFKCLNISAMYANHAHHSSLASSCVSSNLSSVKALLVPPAAHTRAALRHAMTIGAIRLHAPLPFPHIKMQIWSFSEVWSQKGSVCAWHHPTQELLCLCHGLQHCLSPLVCFLTDSSGQPTCSPSPRHPHH